MQNEKENTVCKLCLKSCECIFEDVEAITKEMLGLLRLELDLNAKLKPTICKTCSENLQKCFDFKTVCLYTEDCINSFRDDINNVKLDLSKIYSKKNGKENVAVSKDHSICRLCMEIVKTSRSISLNGETNDVIFVKTIFGGCFSELDLNIIENPVICKTCIDSLNCYFSFIKSGFGMGGKIKEYCEIEGSGNKLQVESNTMLPFEAENTSNCLNGYTDGMDIHKNCSKENELRNEIKLKVENLMQKEFEVVYIKHELNEHEQIDDVKVEKLNGVVENWHEKEQHGEAVLKCENIVGTENYGFGIKHEEINIKTEEGDTDGFQNKLLSVSDLAQYECKICTYKAKRKSSLNRHMLIHKNASEVTMYSCGICTYKAKRKHQLKQHTLIHKNASEVTMHLCEICTYKAKRKSHLQRHMLIHKSASDVTMYSCGICTYKTRRKGYLQEHMMIHKNASERTLYSCGICSHKAKRKSDLKRHMWIHKKASEKTIYSCGQCTYTAKRKGYLQQHMLIHKNASEETMYSCGKCTYKAKRKGDLKRHMLIHKDASDVTMFSCGVCTYETKYKNLKQHMLIHKNASEVTMYSCGICMYKTKYKSYLKQHMLIHKHAS